MIRHSAICLCTFISAHALAQDSGLIDIPLEDLGQLSIHSVAKREAPLSRTASAVYVVTAADIKRSGARSLPEAMRLVPGLHVARLNPGNWAISARGFNGPLADKMEVLIDGRTIYSPLFSGVFWDQQDVMLEDISRIELIRGPGAALWGRNAVNGVINIITRSARETAGGLIGVHGGQEQTARIDARLGTQGKRGSYRVYGTGAGTEQSKSSNEGDIEHEGRHGRIGARADFGTWTVSGEAFSGDVESGQNNVTFSGGHALARYRFGGLNKDRNEWFAYADYNLRDIENGFAERRLTLNSEFQSRLDNFLQGRWLWGAGVQHSIDDIRNSETLQFEPAKENLTEYSAFFQAQWQATSSLRSNLGTKLGYNKFSDIQFQPSARLTWHYHVNGSLWASISHALRSPNRLDRDSRQIGAGGSGSPEGAAEDIDGSLAENDAPARPVTTDDCVASGGDPLVCSVIFDSILMGGFSRNRQECLAVGRPEFYCDIFFPASDPVDLVGNKQFESEELTALEFGWRQLFGSEWAFDIAAFYNQYDKLRGVRTDEEDDTIIDNALQADAWGGELLIDWTPSQRFRTQLSYSWLKLDFSAKPGANDQSAEQRENREPRAHGFLRMDWNAHKNLDIHAALRHVEEIESLSVPSYTDLDLSLSWQAHRDWNLRLSAYNLLSEHEEYGGGGTYPLETSFRIGLVRTWD